MKIDDFTIISNNCWAGTIYESYGLQKKSPTIGMFILPDDYITLVANLREYLEKPLVFIQPEESKWRDLLNSKSNWGTYLIAQLGDIELHMLHHHDESIAREKWLSRVDRINWNRLIYKFNDQNGCTVEHIQRFINLPLQHKLCFVASPTMKISNDVILIGQPIDYKDGIKASREPFGKTKYLDLTGYINGLIK